MTLRSSSARFLRYQANEKWYDVLGRQSSSIWASIFSSIRCINQLKEKWRLTLGLTFRLTEIDVKMKPLPPAAKNGNNIAVGTKWRCARALLASWGIKLTRSDTSKIVPSAILPPYFFCLCCNFLLFFLNLLRISWGFKRASSSPFLVLITEIILLDFFQIC